MPFKFKVGHSQGADFDAGQGQRIQGTKRDGWKWQWLKLIQHPYCSKHFACHPPLVVQVFGGNCRATLNLSSKLYLLVFWYALVTCTCYKCLDLLSGFHFQHFQLHHSQDLSREAFCSVSIYYGPWLDRSSEWTWSDCSRCPNSDLNFVHVWKISWFVWGFQKGILWCTQWRTACAILCRGDLETNHWGECRVAPPVIEHAEN